MYKDKDKQRQAVREATRRYRARLKGITPQPVIPLDDVIPCDTQPVIPVRSECKPLTKDRQLSRQGLR